MISKPSNALGQRGRIAYWHQPSGFARDDEIFSPGIRRDEKWQPATERFLLHERTAFDNTGQHEDIAGIHQGKHPRV